MLTYNLPSESDLPALAAYRRESVLAHDSLDGSAGLGNFADLTDWLARIRTLASPDAERLGWFPTEVLLACDGERLCGIVSIRLTHDPIVDMLAGHIGYHVRLSMRRRGYGSAMLTYARERCRNFGILTPSVTVSPDNTASQKTALTAGFSPDGDAVLENGERILRFRYRD